LIQVEGLDFTADHIKLDSTTATLFSAIVQQNVNVSNVEIIGSANMVGMEFSLSGTF
jgi:hypothetical protein